MRVETAAGSVVLVAIVGLSSCRKDDGWQCPAGTKMIGGGCVPIGDTQVQEGIVIPDQGIIHDDPPGPDPDPEPDDPGVADIPTPDLPLDQPLPETAAKAQVGAACKGDADCIMTGLEGVCLDWPKGYCSVLKCAKDTCPQGGVCMAITPNAPACAASCKAEADCRTDDGYGCKSLVDPDGNLTKVCFQVKKTGGPGEGCTGPQDCAGAATCLTAFPGGYCAVGSCGKEEPCPDGTACVKLNGKPVCLKSCQGEGDCKVQGDLPRQCMAMKSAITLEKVNVCASGKTGVAIGAQCLNDMECLSSDCQVVYTGKCSIDSTGCLNDSECPYGAVCQQSSGNTFGFCTSACAWTSACGGQNFCVGVGPQSSQGICLPACQPGDSTCRHEAGLKCMFGDPLGTTSHYSCVRLLPGAPGSDCAKDGDCTSGKCLLAEGGGGYCTTLNCPLGFCPFPTSCQKSDSASGYRCLKRCLSSGDCPKGHSCSPAAGGGVEVCLP